MIAVQSQHTAIQHHHRHMLSFTANGAGDPLPLIPRRPHSHHVQSTSWSRPLSPPSLSASSSRSPSYPSTEPTILASASIVTITPATPPKTESESDSTPLRYGKKRKRDLHLRVPDPATPCPPKLSPPIRTLRSHSSPSLTFTPISKNSPRATHNAPNPTLGAAVGTRAPVIYTPGIPLRLSMECLRNVSAVGLSLHSESLRPSSPISESLSSSSSLSSVSAASTGGSQASPSNTPLIRKKSGQVVRPSLKSSSSYSASRSVSNLGIMSPDLSLPSSKSEPATPFSATTPTTSKAVHFDKNLERVKLFLTEQKPLAVSREGSPGDTDEGETSASGTETNEIARFFGVLNPVDSFGTPRSPFGAVPRGCATKLLMHTNLPCRALCLSSSTADATLESLLLAKGDKSIQGTVLVRNIAYDKSVTTRFSFDGWCTTSEVNAKWKESVGALREGGTEWDRFEFTIWLGDLKLGEEKGDSRKLELAVRYRVASKGYELWDNNGGRNYVATFERPGQLEEKARGRKARLKKKVPPVPFSDDELSDLLEKFATSKTTRKARSISPTVSNTEWVPMSLEPSASTSVSSKTTCKPVTLHTRTRSFPFSVSSSPNSVEPTFGWMEKAPPSPPSPLVPSWLTKNRMFENQGGMTLSPTTLGSPRDLTDDTFHPRIKFPTILSTDPDESMDDPRPEGRKKRRHHQGGYFDSPSDQFSPQESTIISRKHVRAPAEQTTPTPPPSSRFHSFPPSTHTLRDSTGDGQRLEQMERRVKDSRTDVALSFITPSSASFVVGQGKMDIPSPSPSSLPLGVESNYFPDDTTSDSSSSSTSSTLLESPICSRSSTPPSEAEEEPDSIINDPEDDRELYKEFLNKFCFFTGPGSPSSLTVPNNNNNGLEQVKNRMMNESSSESSTPTLTPSGSGVNVNLNPSDED